MIVDIHSDLRIRVSHYILHNFRINIVLTQSGASCVAKNVGRDVRHLHSVDVVVPLHSVVETMLPVHSHLRHPVLVQIQKAAVTVHELLHLRCRSVLNDRPEAVCHIPCNRKFPCSGIGLGGLDDVLHPSSMSAKADGQW